MASYLREERKKQQEWWLKYIAPLKLRTAGEWEEAMRRKISSSMARQGLTQANLAEAIGVDQGTISAFLCGKCGIGFDNLAKICTLFDI